MVVDQGPATVVRVDHRVALHAQEGKMTVGIKGYSVEIDEEDFTIVQLGGWCPSVCRGKVQFGKKMGGKHVFLHRVICPVPAGFQVDHVDGNTLNNTRVNLRPCTRSQNRFNANMKHNSRSGFKAVYFVSRRNKWATSIGRKWLGYFSTPEEAAAAYRAAAIKIAGSFARW